MKTNKTIITGIVAALILTMGVTSTYAFGGNGGGGGKGMGKYLTQEQKDELHSMSMEERQAYMKENGLESGSKGGDHEHSPADLLDGVALQDLSDEEKEMLYYGYSEELLAHDMYMYFYDLYGVETFKNIGTSESSHMEAVKFLLDRYELEIPTDYGELSDEFEALKAEGEHSLQKALEVGIKIEMLDIEDIADTIKTTDNDDFKIMFTNIGGASYNHLRGFVKALDNNGLTTDIDYSEYLTGEDLNTKGPLKAKFALKLEAEGVELPEAATSKAIQENCDKEGVSQGGKQGGEKGMKNSGNAKKYAGSNTRGVTESLKNRYKETIVSKYQSKIDAMSTQQLEKVLVNIDNFSKEVSSSTKYSELTKNKYVAVLEVLRDLIEAELGVDAVDVDSLLN